MARRINLQFEFEKDMDIYKMMIEAYKINLETNIERTGENNSALSMKVANACGPDFAPKVISFGSNNVHGENTTPRFVLFIHLSLPLAF